MTESPDGLSIGELARRTEVPTATLRSWEDRWASRGRTAWPTVTAATTTAHDDDAPLGSGPQTDELSMTSGSDRTHATATFALD